MASLFYQLSAKKPCTVPWKTGDLVISVTKKSRNQDLGLTLVQDCTADPCLVVSCISDGTPFSGTNLAHDMEIIIINGIECSSLDSADEAYEILKSAKKAVTIVARRRDCIPFFPPDQPPEMQARKIRRSSRSAHMWLEMVNHVNQKSTGNVILGDVLQDENDAPSPTPIIKNSNRSHAKPNNVKLDRRRIFHRVMSEITLYPSQHPVPARPEDIEILQPVALEEEKLSLPSILGALYPDYGERDTSLRLDDIENGCALKGNNQNHASTKLQSTHDVNLTPTTNTESSLESMNEIPLPPLGDDIIRLGGDSFLFQLSRRELILETKQSSCPAFSSRMPERTTSEKS